MIEDAKAKDENIEISNVQEEDTKSTSSIAEGITTIISGIRKSS